MLRFDLSVSLLQVGEVLPSLAPSGLSDIDFLLMIDFVAA
jgi:hypothetical protein